MASRALSGAFALAVSALGLAASAAFAADAPRGTSGLWYRYPLPGAEVKSLVADPAVSGLFWAGTAQGGIYRSADAGASWQSPPEGLAFPGYAVTSLAPDPLRPGVVWAGLTGVVKGGLLALSTDGGRSLRRRAPLGGPGRLARRRAHVGGRPAHRRGRRRLRHRDLRGRRAHVAALDAAARLRQRRVLPRVPPAAARGPLLRHVSPPVPLDGRRADVGADRDRDGAGHRGLRDGLRGGVAGRVLGRDVRVGLPDDGRRRAVGPLQGGPPRPARARRARRPARRRRASSRGRRAGSSRAGTAGSHSGASRRSSS